MTERVWRGNPDLESLLVPIAEVYEDTANARRHDEKNLNSIKGSLQDYGQQKPIVVRESGRCVAGSGTLRVVKELGWTHIARVRSTLSEQDCIRYGISDNRTGELASWDAGTLLEYIHNDSEYDWGRVGFLREDLEMLAMQEPLVDVEEPPTPALPSEAVSKPGDVWLLDKHRVACGDSTDPQVLSAAFGDYKHARMAFTDPPWNVDYGQDENDGRYKVRPILNDDLDENEFQQLMENAAHTLAARVSGDVYVVMGSKSWPVIDGALRKAGHNWHSTIIWNKDRHVLSRGNYHRKYEPIWYGWHKDRTSTFVGRRDQNDVWDVPRPSENPDHPTQKPIELASRAIQNSTIAGDVVFDGFLGSGTTLLAAHQLGRVCVGVELDPRYVDVVVRRFEEATGKKAVRG